MRQLRGRLDWSRARTPRFDWEAEHEKMDQAGYRQQVQREEDRVVAYLSSVAPTPEAEAFIIDFRKVAAKVGDSNLARYDAYYSSIYVTRGADCTFVVTCAGWDHRARAIAWVEFINEMLRENSCHL